MENELNSGVSISGVPEEVQENIAADLAEKKPSEQPLRSRVGISVSENEELGELGYSSIHLRDLTLEIARYLLVNKNTLVYGGDLRKEGYTELFSDLSFQYRAIGDHKEFPFENFFSYPIHCLLTKQNELDFKRNKTIVRRVEPPDELQVDGNKYIQPNSPESKFIWAKSLSKMRIEMIAETDARILVGGKCNNYLGKMPGVIEEALISVQHKRPLYLIGAFGGASNQVIKAIKGEPFSYAATNFHQTQEYTTFKEYYNEHSEQEKIDVEIDSEFFRSFGLQGLSKMNGLSVEENERLFITPHLPEIIYFVFKGLATVLN